MLFFQFIYDELIVNVGVSVSSWLIFYLKFKRLDGFYLLSCLYELKLCMFVAKFSIVAQIEVL